MSAAFWLLAFGIVYAAGTDRLGGARSVPAKAGICSRFPNRSSKPSTTSANAGAFISSRDNPRNAATLTARPASIGASLVQAGLSLVAAAAAWADHTQQAMVSRRSSESLSCPRSKTRRPSAGLAPPKTGSSTRPIKRGHVSVCIGWWQACATSGIPACGAKTSTTRGAVLHVAQSRARPSSRFPPSTISTRR
jgi:hypothetical protein